MASEAMPSLAPGAEDQPEGHDLVILCGPVRPSAQAVDRHNANQMPYSSFPSVCLQARGKHGAHLRRRGEESCSDSLAKVSLDYQELTSKPKIQVSKEDVMVRIIV